ncbi:hypothetical protein F5Y19DRAFT_476539 [Xylariaceae sp. FL1651]|nr:hypothetical protein F5Y19DRAFT_476539 [Xylariaceae sp. FL1651]
MVGFPRVNDCFKKVKLYRERKAAYGGKDPFCPEDQPHFELNYISKSGTIFRWHYPTSNEDYYIIVVVDLVHPVSPQKEKRLSSKGSLAQLNCRGIYTVSASRALTAPVGDINITFNLLADSFNDIVASEYPEEMSLKDRALHYAVLDRC